MTNITSDSDIQAKIFYFNDLHANVAGAKKIKSAADKFDEVSFHDRADTFKFCAGDSYIGRTKNNFIGRFLNLLGLDGMTLGNHELDMGTKQLSKFINSNLFRIFAANIDYKAGFSQNPLRAYIDCAKFSSISDKKLYGFKEDNLCGRTLTCFIFLICESIFCIK